MTYDTFKARCLELSDEELAEAYKILRQESAYSDEYYAKQMRGVLNGMVIPGEEMENYYDCILALQSMIK